MEKYAPKKLISEEQLISTITDIMIIEGKSFNTVDDFISAFKKIEKELKDYEFVAWVNKSGSVADKQLKKIYIEMNKLLGVIPKY